MQVWDISQQQAPLLSFDVGAAVGDVAWAPYSSTVFAAVTDEGKVQVFDLAQNRQLPMCAQKVRSCCLFTACAAAGHPAVDTRCWYRMLNCFPIGHQFGFGDSTRALLA